MITRRTTFVVVLAWLAMSSQRARADAFEVLSWGLHNMAGSFVTQSMSNDFYSVVSNPYNGTRTANHLLSIAQSTYSYAWDSNSGQFNVNTHLTGQAGLAYTSWSHNEFFFRADTELTVSVVGQFTYNLPQDAPRSAGFMAELMGPPNSVVIANQVAGASLDDGDPASGVLNINFNAVVPALPLGQRYHMRTWFTLSSGTTGGSTVLSEGDGFINFTLTPTPEPATGMLLLVGMGMLIRRHRAGS